MILTSRSRRASPALHVEPNMIPFIDVLLVMLVIFLVAAPKPSTDLSVNLPPAGAKARMAALPVLVAAADQNGALALFIDGEAVPAAHFRARLLDAARARNPEISGDLALLFSEAKILFQADQSLRYDAVYGVVDEIGAAGFQKVDLVVEEAA